MPTPPFHYQEPFPLGADETEYRLLSREGVSTATFAGREILQVEPEAIAHLVQTALRDCAFLLRRKHLQQVAAILDDPAASANDRYVALTLLRNAEVSAEGILPFCQDTGTATIIAKKGQQVWTGANDAEWISRGVYECYTRENLRYSQTAALDMYREVNTGTNLPAQIDIFATEGAKYEFLCVAKGGGSANKTYLFQETKALLNPKSLEAFFADKMKLLGTAACPPYHLVFVIGGTSAEACLKTVKIASRNITIRCRPAATSTAGRFATWPSSKRCWSSRKKAASARSSAANFSRSTCASSGLPRHGASCPVGLGVSCSADRNIKGKITKDGIFVEQLEANPGQFIPAHLRTLKDENIVRIDLNRPMAEIRAELSKYPVTTRVLLTGPMIVARDIAHAKLKERIDAGQGLPDYLQKHPVYYAGPAKTPKGYAAGSFGPTTAGRMDSYVDLFQSLGGSLVMIAKGNRSKQVTDACQKYGGFYLGSIGGPAAILAKENIKKVEVLEYPELGMEAIWKIEVEDFPAFILVDDKGNDFFVNACAHCVPAKT
jgi:fumarate hydratase class I